ncbi:hypothetical protein SUDANB105_00789 [Streptomyces sp. enrichment culture]|uniref:hypothetical protein n=1 Tax=Streptomyces sp. enrichment culture TaxID=1795815 RepID=UPI003F56C469
MTSDEHFPDIGVLKQRGLLPETYDCVYVTGSIIRGWGNAGSDYDLYVISDRPWASDTADFVKGTNGRHPIALETTKVAERAWDLEYWLSEQVEALLARVGWDEYRRHGASAGPVTVPERDFLERLLYAVPLHGADWWQEHRERVEQSAFQAIMVGRAARLAGEAIEDAVGMLRSGDHRSAVLAARIAFTYVVDALLTAAGDYSRNPKWHARRFQEVEPTLLSSDEYWAIETMRDYSEDRPEAWVEHVLDVCRRISKAVSADERWAGPATTG